MGGIKVWELKGGSKEQLTEVRGAVQLWGCWQTLGLLPTCVEVFVG